ncbi:hypothetical protein [Enterobacter hormaechei]|uniref:hypothetical protein n=1 Tax=Enterobacter hormaechei TaxID=158836 RepID=UPI0039C25101
MSYNSLILNKLDADRYMANLLDRSLEAVHQQTLQQAKTIYSGVERLSWYSSCFMDNYQDVCTRLKQEDIRFAKAIFTLAKHNDVIREMIEIYVNYMFENLSDQRIRNITRILAMSGTFVTSSTLTRLSIAYSVSALVASSLGMKVSVEGALTTWATRGIALAGAYGYVQIASQAAERLLHKHGRYYRDLYGRDLEMLYFLIEPIIERVDANNQWQKTDQDIVSDIIRLIR